MQQWITVSLVFLILGVVVVCGGHYSEADGRFYFPEFQDRAVRAHDQQRPRMVSRALSEAAGVYKDKSRSAQLGLQQSVFITVVSYTGQARYKALLHNFLCFTEHYGIDLVVYVVQHNIKDWKEEQVSYARAGIRMLSYPDELFWTLMYTKSSMGQGKADYQSAAPSFASHGALVMLVPVLEVLLHGHNCIFFDVDIALVLDPVPFLTRGQADFVSSVEMRSCPDSYTPTYLDSANTAQKHKGTVNSMSGVNWYTVEPNSGIMSVRATDAGIGFYTKWLLRIIAANELNDQKAMQRIPRFAQHSMDCVYGHAHSHHAGAAHGGSSHAAHHGHPHYTHPNHRVSAQLAGQLRAKWASNLTALVSDVLHEKLLPPATFCFVSELLFQNGQTAFACGIKPSYRDAWALEMYEQGLQKHNESHSLHHNARPVPFDTVDTPRFPVAVHANFCDRKTHELAARGLWLLEDDSTEVFSAAVCRAYDPYSTYYATHNWTAEYTAIKSKRQYMVDTFVQPGKLIQSTSGKEVYLVDENLHKHVFPDGKTFIAKMGDDKWGDVHFLPQPLIDTVPTGDPIPKAM